MNARDAQRLAYCNALASKVGLRIDYEHHGSKFGIYNGKQFLGLVETVDQLYHFLCGYEWSYTEKED